MLVGVHRFPHANLVVSILDCYETPSGHPVSYDRKLPLFTIQIIYLFSDPTPTRNYLSPGALDGVYLEDQTYLETCCLIVPVTNRMSIMTFPLGNSALNVVNYIA